MRFPRDKKLASLSPLPIILLATGQSPQPYPGWLLWGSLLISVLLSGASLGLTVRRTNKNNKRIKLIESVIDKELAAYIDSAVTQKTNSWAKEIVDLRAKTELYSRDKRSLDHKIDTLNKKLSDLISQLQLQISPTPYTASLNKVALEDPVLPSIIHHQQSVEAINRPPVQSSPEIPTSTTEQPIGADHQSPSHSKLVDFASAIEMNTGTIIREQSDSELNITKESEDALVRREPGHKTQLEDVNGGGSYYRVADDNRSWLFPTPLTLKTIARNQPAKGLFRYEHEPISMPRIKQPAEIRPTSGNRWEVLEMGVIVVST